MVAVFSVLLAAVLLLLVLLCILGQPAQPVPRHISSMYLHFLCV